MRRSSQVISSGGQLTHSPRAADHRKSRPVATGSPLPDDAPPARSSHAAPALNAVVRRFGTRPSRQVRSFSRTMGSRQRRPPKVTRRIAKDEYLTYANCMPDESQQIVQVRRAQDDYVRVAEAA